MRQRVLLEAQDLIGNVPTDEQWRVEMFMEPDGRMASEMWQMADAAEFASSHARLHDGDFRGRRACSWTSGGDFTRTLPGAQLPCTMLGPWSKKARPTEVCALGVIRAYMTRHGAGPLPSWAPELDAALTDPGNPTNAWQGTIRRGWLDLMLLRYAVEAVGGPLDGLAVNCLDHLTNIAPKICVGYRSDSDPH